MRKSILVIILSLISSWVYAQKPTILQSRKMNLLAIELLDRYELNSSLWNKQAKSRFIKMFENKKTEIFCDLYHDVEHYQSQVPVDKYILFVEKTGSEINKVQVSNIQKKDIWYSDGTWHYSLTFDKEIIYWDSNGVLFPMGVDENGNDARQIYAMEMTLVFDANLENAYIRSLVSRNAGPSKIAGKAIIVEKCDAKYQKFEDKVTSDNQHLQYNTFGQAVVPSYDFKHPDEDVRVTYYSKFNEDAYELIKLKYNVTRLRLKLRNEISPVM